MHIVQVKYWQNEEEKRKNKAAEKQRGQELAETTRSHKAAESIDLSKLGETTRHNKATEAIDVSRLSETTRHNQATEGIDLSKLAETTRSNKAREANDQVANEIKRQDVNRQTMKDLWDKIIQDTRNAETQRHNEVTERIQSEANTLQEMWNAGRLEDADLDRALQTWIAERNSQQRYDEIDLKYIDEWIKMLQALLRTGGSR